MNIIIIENHIISTNTVRQALTKTLINHGHNVTVLSTGTSEELEAAKKRGFKVVDIGNSNTNPLHVFKYMGNIKRELKNAKADICLTFTMRPAIWGNIVTRRLKIPTITNITGIGPLAESNNIAYKVARILYRFVLKKTCKIFFQNEDDRKIFLKRKFTKIGKTEIIPGSGVDYEYFKPLPSQKEGSKFVFLFISRLIKDKGILEYVEASKKLKARNVSFSSQVLGPYYSQNLKDNIITEEQVMHWLNDGIVNYLGASADVRSFIANADCIVLPSYREGMSNVLLEAASMEKPCITTNTTGCNNIVQNNLTGYLCRVKDSEDLADKMEDMMKLGEEERNLMGKRARDIIKRNFSKKIVIDAYLKAIAECSRQST